MTAQPTPARHHQTTEKLMNSALFWILLVEDSFRGFTVGGLPRITVSAVVGDLRGTKIMCQLTYYYGKMVLYKICSMWCLVMHLYKKWQKQIGCFFGGANIITSQVLTYFWLDSLVSICQHIVLKSNFICPKPGGCWNMTHISRRARRLLLTHCWHHTFMITILWMHNHNDI